MPKLRKQASQGGGQEPRVPRPKSKLYAYGVRIPAPYVEVLVREAEFLGIARRSYFLTMLFRRQRNQLRLERSPEAPKYKFNRSELDQIKRFVWVIPIEMKSEVEEEMALLGGLAINAWLVTTINDWLGMP